MAQLLERDPETGRFLPLQVPKIRVERFKEFVKATRSAQTAYSYVAAVRRFEEFLDEKELRLATAPKGTFDDFLVWLKKKKLSSASIRLFFSGVKVYVDWCRDHEEGGCPELKMPRMPSEDPPDPFVLSTEQLHLYFKEVSKLNEPSRTALLILPFCGLRVSELCKLKRASVGSTIDEAGTSWLVFKLKGKGNKIREAPLFQQAYPILDSYMKDWRGTQPKSDWLFPGKYADKKNGGVTPLSAKTLQAHLRNIREKVNLPKQLTPHALRRTCFTNLHRQGVSIATIAKVAGHSNISTTIKYYIATSTADVLKELSALKGQKHE